MAAKGSEAPTSIRFPAHLKRELRIAAANEDSTMEDVIIECFRVWKDWRSGRLPSQQRKPVALSKETGDVVQLSPATAELLGQLLQAAPETWLQQIFRDLLEFHHFARKTSQAANPAGQSAEAAKQEKNTDGKPRGKR